MVFNDGANEGFWRFQIRDRYGNWIKMGGSILFDTIHPLLGRVKGVGVFVGGRDKDTAIVEIVGHPTIKDGQYDIPRKDIDGIKATIPKPKPKPKPKPAPVLRPSITGDEALQKIYSSIGKYAKSQGRFPVGRNRNDVVSAAKETYKTVYEKLKVEYPDLMTDISTYEDYWDIAFNNLAVGIDTKRELPIDDINPLTKASNKIYAREVLGVEEGGTIEFYKNAVRHEPTKASAAAGYVSLHRQLAWDRNSNKSRFATRTDGRYVIKAKPEEVDGLLGISQTTDDFGVIVGADVTSKKNRIQRVGDIEPQRISPWSDDIDTYRRSDGSPYMEVSLASQFDVFPTEHPLPGTSFIDFYKFYGLNPADNPLGSKWDEMYGKGSFAELNRDYPEYNQLQRFFVNAKTGDNKVGLDLAYLGEFAFRSGDPSSNDRYDKILKMLSVIQELSGRTFMVHRGHDSSDVRVVQAEKQQGYEIDVSRKEPEDTLDGDVEKTKEGVSHTFEGREFFFTLEEMEKAYYYVSQNARGALDATDEQGKEFNERMRALTDYLRPGRASNETIAAQEKLIGFKIPINELRHSAPPGRFDEIMNNGIRPKITDKVGSENYSKRRFGVFLANGYTSSEADRLADVFRVKVPENDLRVDSGYTENGRNLYVERTIKPEELEYLGHLPATGADPNKENQNGLHDGRGANCEECARILGIQNQTGIFKEYDADNSKNAAEQTPLTELGFDPEEEITIYRGVPKGVKDINAGDWVTTLPQLAKDYAGDGDVISIKVKAKDLLADPSSGEGAYTEEMVYRPEEDEAISEASEGVAKAKEPWKSIDTWVEDRGNFTLDKNVYGTVIDFRNNLASPVYAVDAEMISKEHMAALKRYTNTGYRYINNYLRFKNEFKDLDSKKIAEIESNIAVIDEMIEENGEVFENSRVFRGQYIDTPVNSTDTDWPAIMENLEVGDTISDSGYMSTSNDPIIAFKEFGPGSSDEDWLSDDVARSTSSMMKGSIFWMIDVPEGSKAFALPEGSGYASGSEREVILPRGSQLKVKAVRRVQQLDSDLEPLKDRYNYYVQVDLIQQDRPGVIDVVNKTAEERSRVE